MKKEKVVLAFSGGLDTSFCVKYLSEEKGYEVHTAIANTGGFSPAELKVIEQKALALGAASHVTLDIEQEYYEKSIKYMVFGNILRNGTYPISVSSERIFQAIAIIEYAKKIGADYVAHGSTGAGNDQVRFDLTFQILAPEIGIVTPTRDMTLTREYEIDYLKKHGYEADFKKLEYSINKGLWGTSIGGKETLHSEETLPEEAYPSQVTEHEPRTLRIAFERGEIAAVDGKPYADKVEAIRAVEAIGAKYGIGPDLLGVLDDGDGLEDALGTHRDGIGSVSEDIPEDHVADALLVVLLFDVECGVLDGPELHGTLLDAFEFGFGEASGIGDGRVDIVTLLLGEVLHTERGVQPAAERQHDFFLGIHGFISYFYFYFRWKIFLILFLRNMT